MVSTFLEFRQLTGNFKHSLDRVASSSAVERETAYYKANIGKVTSVDDFMKDFRLYSYAMKAHGLEDMIYAKAFMQKVLESDLTNADSYANRLSDDRYRNFATAFQFGSGTPQSQTTGQIDNVIAEHKQTLIKENDAIVSDNATYKASIGKITSVDQLLGNEKLRDIVLKAFDVDSKYWSRDHLTKVLTSDLNDPASYVNTLKGANAGDYKALAAAFNFNAAGGLDAGVAIQDANQITSTLESYTFTAAGGRPLPVVGQMNADFYRTTLPSIGNVDDLVNNSRMLSFVKTAFGLPQDTLKSTVKNILTSDLTDPNNYAKVFGGEKYETIVKGFNFNADGTLKAGMQPQDTTQLANTTARYMTTFDDEQESTDAGTYDFYSSFMKTIDDVDGLMSTARIYNFVLDAFGLDPKAEKKDTIQKALTSDLADPKSFANTQKDPRYADLARAFNFDAKGKATAPHLALSQSDIVQISKDYIILQTRFGNTDKKDAATKEASYFNEQMQKIDNVDEFLADSRLVNFVLESKGIASKDVTPEFAKKLFKSDVEDPKSFVNQQDDKRYRQIMASFNFDKGGNITRVDDSGIQSRAGTLETEDLYLHQVLEEQSGETNPGVRLALYFTRMAPDINSAYDILGDTALLEVFRTAFSLPKEMSSMNIDKQKALVEQNLNLADLQDPDKLSKFMSRFTALYDLANDTSQSSTVSLFGKSGGISADTLLSIAQLKAG